MPSIDVFAEIPELPARELREEVRRLEDAGLTGLFAGDHYTYNGRDGGQQASYEPLTMLATAGAMSDRLVLGTQVMNAAWIHPALLIRPFSQLAALFGGERVVMGLGAGWNRPEFEFLGMRMPPFGERVGRLETACALARALFDDGVATIDGVAANLPIAPKPEVAPRLMIGGGSDRVLEIGGRYADVFDLFPPPELWRAEADELHTTVGHLERAAQEVTQAAKGAGRPRPTMSIPIGIVRFCKPSEVEEIEARICERHGVAPRSLRDKVQILIGDAARIRDLLTERRERIGFRYVTVPTRQAERFCREVLD